MADKNKFNIIKSEERAVLDKSQLVKLLEKLPMVFYTVDQSVPPTNAIYKHETGEIEVRHSACVVEFHPPRGKYLSNAMLTDMDFPIRPDNIMDENIKLRCCFHPRLSSFGLENSTKRGTLDKEIELDIFKFPHKENYVYVTEEDL